MKRLFLLLPMIIVCALPSCYVMTRVPVNPDYTMNFNGQTKHDIILQIGVPDNEESDGKGGTIYEYKNRAKLQSKAEYFKQLQSGDSVSVSYVRNIAFFFDSEDSCYFVKTEATDLQQRFNRTLTTVFIVGLSVGATAHILLGILMALDVNIPLPPIP